MKARDLKRSEPLRTVIVPRSWWDARFAPDGDVCLGLRNVSDAEEGMAREEAAKLARQVLEGTEDQDAAVAEFNDELMARIVGAHLCDPNNAKSDPEELPTPTESLRSRMSAAGIRRLWHEVEKLRVETVVSFREASDEELVLLADALVSDAAATLPPEKAQAARRFAAHLLDLIHDA